MICKPGEDFLDKARRAGALVTDGVVAEKGWGKAAFSRAMTAHFWTRSADLGRGSFGYRSQCGLRTVSTPQVPLFGAGNFPFCARCENRLMKEARA